MNPAQDYHYDIKIDNYDEIKNCNPMLVDKITFKLEVKLKPKFPGAIT